MPAKKGSKKLTEKNSFLGKFQKNKKNISEMEKKITLQKDQISALENIVTENSNTLMELNKKIDNQRNKVTYKRKKMRNLHAALNVIDNNNNLFC